MTDYAGFRHGQALYPLTASTSNGLLKDADPAIYYALDYFKAMLTTHLGSRFVAEATAIGMTSLSAIVAAVVPMDPLPWLTAQQFKFPLLALYRSEEEWSTRTAAYRHSVSKLTVEYILPPLDGAQGERLLPILPSVARVLDNRIQQGWDPTYTPPGGTLGGHVWSSTYAFLEDVRLLSGKFVKYENGGDLVFPGWVGVLEVKERAAANMADFVTLAGVDTEEKLVNPGDTTIDDFVDFKSDVTPPGPSTAGT